MKRTALMILLAALALSVAAAAEPAKAKTTAIAPALLVIDVQNAYLPYMDEKDKKMAMEGINYYIQLFRANDFPVIRVYHTDPAQGWPKPGSEEFQFPKTVAVREDDPMVVKNYGNAFRKTELDKLLKEKGRNTLFLCGLSAVGCVLATYHGAMDHDYEVFMCRQALISHDAALTKAVQEFCQTIDYAALKLVLSPSRR
ncbi:MAG TPA: isochorismatase family protein [Candidatus Aminicenantes bacterium]|nr:isochorismatase family protein [Candidatus Aminicenantes bacterium]